MIAQLNNIKEYNTRDKQIYLLSKYESRIKFKSKYFEYCKNNHPYFTSDYFRKVRHDVLNLNL